MVEDKFKYGDYVKIISIDIDDGYLTKEYKDTLNKIGKVIEKDKYDEIYEVRFFDTKFYRYYDYKSYQLIRVNSLNYKLKILLSKEVK